MARLGRAFPVRRAIRGGPPLPIYDATGAGNNTAFATTCAWSHTAAARATVLAAFTGLDGSGAASPTISSVTYGSLNMSLVGSVFLNNTSSSGELFVYSLFGAPSGSQTITVTATGNSVFTANSVSYLNVRTLGAAVTTFGSGSSVSQSAGLRGASGVFSAFGSFNTSYSSIAGGNSRYNAMNASGTSVCIQDLLSPASVTFSANLSASDSWSGLLVTLNPSPLPQS